MVENTELLGQIKFKKDFKYTKKVPTLVSNSVSCIDEIARWALDLKGILYKDEPHAPGLYVSVVNKLTGQKGIWNNPVLLTTDALIYTAPSIVQYLDQRTIPSNRLISDSNNEQKKILELQQKFFSELAGNLSEFVYSIILSHRRFAIPLFTNRVPLHEKIIFKLAYPLMRKALAKGLNLPGSTNEKRLIAIKKQFQDVDGLLSDGRKYLVGDKLTLADISFASIAAPLILPDQFGAVITKINEIPDELRKVILELRTTNAGQFVLRLYREDRLPMRDQNDLLKEPGILSRIGGGITVAIFGNSFRVNLFYSIQRHLPVVKLWFTNLVIVNKHELVVNVLNRDEDFTIEEINSKKMSDLDDTFFLGMDRSNPLFDRERNFVRKASKKEDMELIRGFVRSDASKITSLAEPYGKLDVANSLNRVVMVRLISNYFGIPSPTETKMKEWLRSIFWDLFLNLGNNPDIHQKAKVAATGLKSWIEQLIKDRKNSLKQGVELDDNLFNRLILMQQEKGNDWFNDDALRRNISGIITGALETTNKSVVLVLDELFRRPDVLQDAIAVTKEGDMKSLYGFVSEALRFNPHQPILLRYNEKKQVINSSKKEYTIQGKRKIFATIAAAMFDPGAFPNPKAFNPSRESTYMNYGFALHECYGKYINAVTITELVAAVLSLPNVWRIPGSLGKGTGLNEGPFPNNFVVQFD